MVVLRKNEKTQKTKQKYLYEKVQLYIKLVRYIENDKGNGLNAHILELVLNNWALKIFLQITQFFNIVNT